MHATEHAKVGFGRCPSLPTALPHSCFSPERQPNDWVRTTASLRALGARGIPQLNRRDQRLHWSGNLIRFGLAASASCGNPPTRWIQSFLRVCRMPCHSRYCLDNWWSVAGGTSYNCRRLVVSKHPNGLVDCKTLIAFLASVSMLIFQWKLHGF